LDRLADPPGVCRAVPGQGGKTERAPLEMPPITAVKAASGASIAPSAPPRVFAKNNPISQLGVGQRPTRSDLAELMLTLQRGSCHNYKFVTPSNYAAQMLSGLAVAAEGR
jgi:putative pyruvate formate lyase activating enzyme